MWYLVGISLSWAFALLLSLFVESPIMELEKLLLRDLKSNKSHIPPSSDHSANVSQMDDVTAK